MKLQSSSLAPGNPAPPASFGLTLLSLIEALHKDRLMDVLAEPSFTTLPDTPGCYLSETDAWGTAEGKSVYRGKDSQGKEITRLNEFGTRFDFVGAPRRE